MRWILTGLLAMCICGWVGPNAQAGGKQLAHMVFFELKDNTAANRDKLIKACNKYLSKHDGTVYYSAGARVAELKRGVNVTDFDVALHLVFANKAAHDKYQTHPRHLKFIEENKDMWKSVRVFDSYVAGRRKGIGVREPAGEDGSVPPPAQLNPRR